MAKCLHQLIGPTNIKKMKGRKVREEVTTLENKNPNLTKPSFVWVSEHQKASDTLKLDLTIAPVLGYPDFNVIGWLSYEKFLWHLRSY